MTHGCPWQIEKQKLIANKWHSAIAIHLAALPIPPEGWAGHLALSVVLPALYLGNQAGFLPMKWAFYGCYGVFFQSKLKKINEKWEWSPTKRTDAAAASRRISTWWLPAHFPVWMRRMWLGDRGLAFGASAFSAAALATLAFSRGFGFAKSWNPMAAFAARRKFEQVSSHRIIEFKMFRTCLSLVIPCTTQGWYHNPRPGSARTESLLGSIQISAVNPRSKFHT